MYIHTDTHTHHIQFLGIKFVSRYIIASSSEAMSVGTSTSRLRRICNVWPQLCPALKNQKENVGRSTADMGEMRKKGEPISVHPLHSNGVGLSSRGKDYYFIHCILSKQNKWKNVEAGLRLLCFVPSPVPVHAEPCSTDIKEDTEAGHSLGISDMNSLILYGTRPREGEES